MPDALGRRSPPPRADEARLPTVTFSVTAPRTERLDRFLADQLGLSRTRSARLVADGRVKVGGVVARASRTLLRGESVEVTLADSAPRETLAPHPINLIVRYEDDHLAIIDKPAGLVVHPAPGHWNDTLVNALVARGTSLSEGTTGRPGIVHRLDRDTSGLMVIAKSEVSHRRLGAALAARQIHRSYAVLAWGHLDRSPQSIDAPIGRHPTDRKRMTVRPDGRPARTDVTLVARFEVAEILRAELQSGRTHQIRVHLAHVGHPVVGDPVYGGGGPRRISGSPRVLAERLDRAATRQALHAAVLRFSHPVTGQRLAFRSEWPADLAPIVQVLAGHVDPPHWLTYLGFYGPDD
jgi:23S rRNA pseudouridine1911/1915/1917 synthase